MFGIHAVEPLGKESNHSQAVRPWLLVRFAKHILPSKEDSGADGLGDLTFREADKLPQDSLFGGELVSEAAPDKIMIEFLRQGAHRAPPATGQGCAIDRRPSTSSFA